MYYPSVFHLIPPAKGATINALCRCILFPLIPPAKEATINAPCRRIPSHTSRKGTTINAPCKRIPSHTSRKGSNNQCTMQAYSISYLPQRKQQSMHHASVFPPMPPAKGSDTKCTTQAYSTSYLPQRERQYMHHAGVFHLIPPAKGATIYAPCKRIPSHTSRKGSNNKCTTQAYSFSYLPQREQQ